MDFVIIKSRVTGQKNWIGKEFSDLPAKAYSTFFDAAQAINQYWVNEWNIKQTDSRVIEFKYLTAHELDSLIKKGLARL
jgi:hypothetical protein